MEYWLH